MGGGIRQGEGHTVCPDRGECGETAEDKDEGDDHQCEPSRVRLKGSAIR